ncbi:hypothetical protein EV356DRAFT_168672 [Viridothelium virens]|uniref:Uncharacterized protein n=1 Tax=Viridothelium virens TaxID=1048519 RepID=A0A6A6HP65_VIRVR|nr:hypothetical protein EV356DRAFT_168672 [Viridothelium virens]
MNWTGGKLQRHKHSGNGRINRQKAFFARQRTNLQNAPLSNSTPTIPFFQNEKPSGHVSSLVDLNLSRPELISQKANKCIQRGNKESLTSTVRFEGRVKKRKRQISDRGLSSRGQDSEPLGEVETCRKRLLEQGDWLELAPTRPLQVHFSRQEKRYRFGKRRRIGEEFRPAEKIRTRLPVLDDDVSKEIPLMSGAFNNVVEPVHVRIGKDALATETRVSGQSSVNNEHTPQRDPSPDSMLLDAEETNELEDAEVWTLKASRPSTRHIQGSNSAHSNDQDSVREDHQIFQGISTERDWTRISTACDKLEGFLGSSRSDLKDGSPEQRLVFPTPDLDSRSVNTSRVESEDQAEGLEETNYAWRAFLHLPNETSELALGSARTQGSLSMNITEDRETLASQHPACAMGSRFGTTSAEGASQELNSSGTGVPVSSNYP